MADEHGYRKVSVKAHCIVVGENREEDVELCRDGEIVGATVERKGDKCRVNLVEVVPQHCGPDACNEVPPTED